MIIMEASYGQARQSIKASVLPEERGEQREHMCEPAINRAEQPCGVGGWEDMLNTPSTRELINSSAC